MSTEIKNLEPKCLWEIFYDLTQIPRPSHHEEKVREWAVQFGKKLGLETTKDEAGNVIIKKPATPGMENRKTVILQGHLDMVPQKNNAKIHDFENDPIDAYVDGKWVTADGTTLGADNGIGASSALAVLADGRIKHGPVEVLLTATEETGMDGANGLKPGIMNGDILLNLDTEDEGVFSVGCAGGVDFSATFKNESQKANKKRIAFKLSITGLKGGHSGLDIHLGRGNSNKIFFRVLKTVSQTLDVKLADIQGGSLRNAIPRETFGIILVKKEQEEALKVQINKLAETIKAELVHADPELAIVLTETEMPKTVMDRSLQQMLTHAVVAAPNGVIRMSDTMPGTVETSTNLAIVKSDEKKVEICCLVRSFSESSKSEVASRLESVFSLAGANVSTSGNYPGWLPNVDSEILGIMQQRYEIQFGKQPRLLAMHAGLECGILGATYPNWDMVSFGPTIKHPHSPDEKVNIKTVEKYWHFLLNVLAHVPEK